MSTGGTVPKGDYERFDAELEPQSMEEQGVKVRAAHSAVHTVVLMYARHATPSLALLLAVLCIAPCSCLALSDLLVVSATEDIVPYLPQLWELCLRVQDDIKAGSPLLELTASFSYGMSWFQVCDVMRVIIRK